MSDEDELLGLYYYRQGENIYREYELNEQLSDLGDLVKNYCNSENLHFLIGSGCSLPSIKLMGETFKTIKTNELNSNLQILGKFSEEDNLDIESYLNWLSNAIVFYDENEEGEKFREAFNSTKRALVKSINQNYEDLSNEKTRNTLNNYKEFYNNIFMQREYFKKSPVNIFTTNYDLFNEVAMEQLSINYTNGFRGTVNRVFDPSAFRLRLVDDENRYKDKWDIVRKYIKLYKIHGSIDWKLGADSNNIYQSYVSEDNYRDVMIYPTINKHYETLQTPYSELFREFATNLQKINSTLFVIGYGFPDNHINQMISQSLNNDHFNLIVFGDREEMGAQEFIKLHSDKPNFHFIGGTLDNDGNKGHYFANVIKYLSYGDENIEK
ncbi:SIR2 family protein [Shouchella lehensis]|uniref:Uncharacterized protein n=1 Tax=Shouchella lehensis G1 TaxID=1246626 RepID=A0A060LMW9_9BACI|nr:SIR2 family protein [Shouchella lehensis]AIC92711.1 hypothetical protein BleG1_0096 [Shouchella lehensis G1]